MFGSCKPPNPINDFSTCRSVKSTPLHKSQAESGAVFEQQLNLFERAAWFDNSPVDDDYGKTSSAPPDSKIISGCRGRFQRGCRSSRSTIRATTAVEPHVSPLA